MNIINEKEKILNRVSILIVLLTFPVILNNIFRFFSIGHRPILLIAPFLILLVIISYGLKDYLTYHIRAFILIILVYALALFGYLDFGLQSMSSANFILSITLAIIFLELKYVIGVSCLSVVTFIILGILTLNKIIVFNYDIISYQTNGSGFLTHLLTLIVNSLILVTAIYSIKTLLKKKNDSINRINYQLKLLVNSIESMVYVTDHKGVVLNVNDNLLETLNKTSAEVIGNPFTQILNTNTSKITYNKQFEVMKKNNQRVDFVLKGMEDKASKNAYQLSLIPQVEDGKILSVIGVIKYVTEGYRSQKDIQLLLDSDDENIVDETLDELAKQERLAMLGDLVAGFTHEINTPLGVAITANSFVEDLNEKTSLALFENRLSKAHLEKYFKDTKESSQIIGVNLTRAASLIKSFKAISVEQSYLSLIKFDFHDYINDIVTALKHEFKRTNHKIIVSDDVVKIKSYPGVFSQIFTNLIMNSLKHAFEEEDHGLIEIKGQIVQNNLLIEYRDNGKGISKENITKIFDKFFTTDKENGGSGLGMSIVYDQITNKLGGNITCTSSLGEGVFFSIFIPNVGIVEEVEYE